MATSLAYRSKGSLSSSDSEGSDQECLNWKRITKNDDSDLEKIPIAPPPTEPSSIQSNDGSLKRKRNNIWCEVLQDQMMSESLNHVGIKNKPKNYGDRGEESYDYRLGKRYHQNENSDGMSDDSQASSLTRHKKFKSDKFVEVDKDSAAAAKKIIKTLNEQKSYLIFRIVKYLGIEKAMDILKQTEDIEENGGMMIKNQERRRTPGGVYLHLLRNDKSIEKEAMDKIFEGELNSYEKKKKFDELRKKKKRKNSKRRNKSKNSMDVDSPTRIPTEDIASHDMEASSSITECSAPLESERTSDLEEGEVE